MRTKSILVGVAVAGVLAIGGGVASADVAGTYDVKFEEVSTNCTQHKLAYRAGKLEVRVKGNSVVVDVERTPEMVGSMQKAGKLSAKSRLKDTTLEGMKGVFSIAGRVSTDGAITLVLVGEYSANGKALCTQAWNVTGTRASKATKKSSAVDGGERHAIVDYFEDLASIAR